VNLLVLDTEVYSNTGGQQSKATPLGAAAKFASAGKETPKKDLGMMALTYGNVYVARIAFGAKDAQTVQAFLEAESYPGPSLLIAYSPCIAHGYDLAFGAEQQKLAVQSGHWPLFRYDPRLRSQGENPLKLDSGPIKADLEKYMRNETRYRIVEMQNPENFRRLLDEAKSEAFNRYSIYEQLSKFTFPEASGKQH
jgi:pyruvate-ferredoxin/flavodoxin oxidoreductase